MGCFSRFLTEALNQLTHISKRTEYIGSMQWALQFPKPRYTLSQSPVYGRERRGYAVASCAFTFTEMKLRCTVKRGIMACSGCLICLIRAPKPCSKAQQLSGDVLSLPLNNTNSQVFTCPVSFFLQTPKSPSTAACMHRMCHYSFAVILDLLHKDQGKLEWCIFKLWRCSKVFIADLSVQTTLIYLLLFVVQGQYTQILHIKISQGQQVITLNKSNNIFEITWLCNVRLL